jgi:hypothetical protein
MNPKTKYAWKLLWWKITEGKNRISSCYTAPCAGVPGWVCDTCALKPRKLYSPPAARNNDFIRRHLWGGK